MSVLNFPTTGLYNGYQYVGANGITYMYDGTKWLGHIPSTTGSNSISNSGNVIKVDNIGNLVMPNYTLPVTPGTFGEVLSWPLTGSILTWTTSSSAGFAFSGTIAFSNVTNVPAFSTATLLSELVNDLGYLTVSTLPPYPIIPTDLSSFTNSTGYIKITDIPSNISSFNNDAGYLTVSTLPPYPIIPAALSSFTNDTGYIKITDIPTNISSFNNDAGYLTNTTLPTDLGSFTNSPGYITARSIPTNVSSFNNDAGYLTPTSTVSYSNISNAPFIVISQYLSTSEKIIALSTASSTGLASGSGIQIGPVTGAYATWTFDGSSNWQSSGGIKVGSSGLLTVQSTVTSVSSSTGALLVSGGVGIRGNINVGGTITSIGNISAGSNTVIAGTFQGNANSSGGMNSASAVGFLGMPQNAQTGTSYTLTLSDQGKHLYASNATSSIIIPANTVTSFPVGTTVAIIAGPSTTATITSISDTLYLGGSGTTGNRTLSPFGMATIVKVTTSTWFINGTGLY